MDWKDHIIAEETRLDLDVDASSSPRQAARVMEALLSQRQERHREAQAAHAACYPTFASVWPR